MAKLKLLKNNNIVFEKEGILKNNLFTTENIQIDTINHILTREDKNYKYTLNFKNNNAEIILKEHNYILNINLTTTSILKTDTYLEIIYTIESEEKVNNTILLTFE